MLNMMETGSVANNLKRAYRDAEPSDLPPEMQDLLRKLQEQDEDEGQGEA